MDLELRRSTPFANCRSVDWSFTTLVTICPTIKAGRESSPSLTETYNALQRFRHWLLQVRYTELSTVLGPVDDCCDFSFYLFGNFSMLASRSSSPSVSLTNMRWGVLLFLNVRMLAYPLQLSTRSSPAKCSNTSFRKILSCQETATTILIFVKQLYWVWVLTYLFSTFLPRNQILDHSGIYPVTVMAKIDFVLDGFSHWQIWTCSQNGIDNQLHGDHWYSAWNTFFDFLTPVIFSLLASVKQDLLVGPSISSYCAR